MRLLAVLAFGVLSAAAARAQEQPGTIPGDRIEAAPQISASKDRGLIEDQLSPQKAVRPAISQVATLSRDTQPPQANSNRSVGRTGIAEAIGGKDRCDAAVPKAKRSPACNNILEARADEFENPPRNQLSPEQRLLLTREIQAGGNDIVEATRRLANKGEADDSVESMGVASVVLDQNKPALKPGKPDAPVIDEQTQAIINAIVTQPQR